MENSKKPMSKTEVISALLEASQLTKPQVVSFFDELSGLIAKIQSDSVSCYAYGYNTLAIERVRL